VLTPLLTPYVYSLPSPLQRSKERGGKKAQLPFFVRSKEGTGFFPYGNKRNKKKQFPFVKKNKRKRGGLN